MTDFRSEIIRRVSEARQALSEARDNDDHYLVDVRLGELDGLARIASDHGIAVPGVDDDLAMHGIVTGARLQDAAEEPRIA